jgi:hypothetical protein
MKNLKFSEDFTKYRHIGLNPERLKQNQWEETQHHSGASL